MAVYLNNSKFADRLNGGLSDKVGKKVFDPDAERKALEERERQAKYDAKHHVFFVDTNGRDAAQLAVEAAVALAANPKAVVVFDVDDAHDVESAKSAVATLKSQYPYANIFESVDAASEFLTNDLTITVPIYTNEGTVQQEVPDADEVLEFANKVRRAGGADVLEELLPSIKKDKQECLIANALNFKSEIYGLTEITSEEEQWPERKTRSVLEEDGSEAWGMYFPKNMDKEQAQKIADAVGCPLVRAAGNSGATWAIKIPASMRNAAIAFDKGIAFKEFVKQVFKPTFYSDPLSYKYDKYDKYGNYGFSNKW